jgi:hypothetical protein
MGVQEVLGKLWVLAAEHLPQGTGQAGSRSAALAATRLEALWVCWPVLVLLHRYRLSQYWMLDESAVSLRGRLVRRLTAMSHKWGMWCTNI